MKQGLSYWISLLALAALACGSGKKVVVVAPEYQPEYAVVFDDLLVPELFGLDIEGRNPPLDPRLRERSLRADVILPARVETVSRVGGVENKGAYELVVRGTGPALFGTTPSEPLFLHIGAGSPSYAWVEGAGVRWVGTRLILFLKRFKGGKADKGDVIHYRGEPDTAEMRAAVNRHLATRVLPMR
jgi:hypothetical protein